MKDHELREFINELTATAVKHKDCQSMREAIAFVVKERLGTNAHPLEELARRQTRLPPEFEKALHDNIWELQGE